MKVVKTKEGYALETEDNRISVAEWTTEYEANKECARINKENNRKYEEIALNNGISYLKPKWKDEYYDENGVLI